ncbi:MAG: DUF4440 domain-containing protein [Ahniella sp.]|nr:DUF4440 domain-containing protein [Ahniella sp.]
MSLSTPELAVTELDEAFARRDLEAVLSHYEDDAVLVVEPGRIARGKEQLRRVFEYLFTLNGTAKQLDTHVLETGDIALFTSRWVFKGIDSSGVPFERESNATSVFRRGADGFWRMIIDNSYGPAVLDRN